MDMGLMGQPQSGTEGEQANRNGSEALVDELSSELPESHNSGIRTPGFLERAQAMFRTRSTANVTQRSTHSAQSLRPIEPLTLESLQREIRTANEQLAILGSKLALTEATLEHERLLTAQRAASESPRGSAPSRAPSDGSPRSSQRTQRSDPEQSTLAWMERWTAAQLADRQAERREEAAIRAEERRELWTMIATLQSTTPPPATHTGVPGKRMGAEFRNFDGSGETPEHFISEFVALAGSLTIPENVLGQELRLRLRGPALEAYDHRFRHLEYGQFPQYADIVAALYQDFGKSLQAAGAFKNLTSPHRPAGMSGQAFLLLVNNARATATAYGIPMTVTAIESRFYGLQNGLTESELYDVTALLCADAHCSEAALHKLTGSIAATPAARTSIVPNSDARERLFTARVKIVEDYLRSQENTPRQAPAPAARQQAKVATTLALTTTAPAAPATIPATPHPRTDFARVAELTAAWGQRSRAGQDRHGNLRAAPEYFGPNQTHKSENQAEFVRRQSSKSCFGCRVDQLVPNQLHFNCAFHGAMATPGQARVKGSGPAI